MGGFWGVGGVTNVSNVFTSVGGNVFFFSRVEITTKIKQKNEILNLSFTVHLKNIVNAKVFE